MADASHAGLPEERVGLCADCVYGHSMKSDRGSVFLLCELSRKDQRFAKYPKLPVLSCPGYEKKPGRADPS
jgi:hypothetical protein